MSVDYLVYDVFTDRAFGGNQLAVIPDATPIPETVLQAIATEFRFSETVFITPSEQGDLYRDVRIFTPTTEVPFAGHPTIGTALALHDLGAPDTFTLGLGVGPIACKVHNGEAAFRATTPLSVLGHPSTADVAACLGLAEDAIHIVTHPPVLASVGLPFCLVELADADALARARPVIDAFHAAQAIHPLPFDFAIYCYTRDDTRIDARMFAPLDDIFEDPATGSAAAALGAFLAETLAAPQTLSITQGVAMGRPSQIGVSADPTGVTIRGRAVKTMSGTLHLPAPT